MSCLFQSIGRGLNKSNEVVRREICTHLQNDPHLFSDHFAVVDAAYIQHMRRRSTWGGGIEIRAACLLYNVHIHVLDARGRHGRTGTWIQFQNERLPAEPSATVPDTDTTAVAPPSVPRNSTIKLRWTGGHYTFISRE